MVYFVLFSAPSNTFRKYYTFTAIPIMKSEENAVTSIELFHKRMNLRRWFILGDNIIDSYQKITGERMVLLEKRCESDKMNILGQSCSTF